VVIPADIIVAAPLLWPWNNAKTKECYKEIARDLPVAITDLKVDAIFIYNDPTDWAADLQIITDLLMSENGYISKSSLKNGNPALVNNGWQGDGQPHLIFSNGDLFFASQYPNPCFGQGAVIAALEGIWNEVTNGTAKLKKTVLGKPGKHAYEFTEVVLKRHRKDLLGDNALDLKSVYMIGDNPTSDIQGANNFKGDGTKWQSILVETGVYKAGTKPKYEPTVTKRSVREAVGWALEREGYKNSLC
jgi:HAD superfamily hydrolase (TIGR01456 family)